MKKIIVVGSGPVGGFMAVLCALLGYIVAVYEKREEFTRNINLKIESNFFKGVHEVISRLNITSEFFFSLNNLLQAQNNKILIKDLEKKFSDEAKALGALYIIKEVKNFSELLQDHEISNPIFLDCTGRSSKLRVDEFGADGNNVITTPLQNAMYINFKAKVNGNLSLYQSMKYLEDVKLSEVIVSRQKDERGFSNVTIPAFITKQLADVFDQEYPDISRNPVNPFNIPTPDSVFFPISALLGNLVTDGCAIDLNSVAVKKIEISCGYARKRSRDNLVCLGDSAVHLAFFKSLNLGLKHGLELFVQLSILRGEKNLTINVLKEFKQDNPLLNAIRFYMTEGENVFLVVTRLVWYGCFSYCYTTRRTERLTNQFGVTEDKIDHVLQELNRKIGSWSFLLINFESRRDQDIAHEVRSNKEKNVFFDHTSWVISLNGKSVIKISELARALKGKYLLVQKDFEMLSRLFEERRVAIILCPDEAGDASRLIRIIKRLLCQVRNSDFCELRNICSSETHSDLEKLNLLAFTVERTCIKTGKLGLMVGSSAASVGIYSPSDHTISRFVLDIVKNELASKPRTRTFNEGSSTSSGSARDDDFDKCSDEDLITF